MRSKEDTFDMEANHYEGSWPSA